MDDLPESMRMRMRRQTSFQQDSAREASEDGDFVTLKNVRKKFELARNTQKKASPIKELDEDDGEEILSPVKVFSPRDESLSVEAQHLERVRVKLFDAAASGSMSVIAETMAGLDARIHQEKLRDPRTGMNVLHHALHLQQLDVAEYLLERGSTELAKQEYFLKKGTRCALHQITELGNVMLAKKLLSKFKIVEERLKIIKKVTEVEIEGQRPRTFSSFHLAAFKGFTDLVNLYLDEGIDIDLVNVKKDTALLWAARWGHDDTVNCLLNRKPPANVNIENDKKSTALHWAVRYQFTSTVKLLLEKGGADPNHERLIGLVTPLVLASAYGNNDIVKLLLQNKAKTNHAIRGGEVALHHAAKEGHLDVVKTLLSYGADIKKEDEKGDRALSLAACNSHSEIVKLLIQHGSDISHKNHTGHDAWYHALNSDDNGVLKALTDHYNKLKANNDNIRLKSPISIAATLGKTKKIKKLIKLGVDPTEKDADGNTFLHHAAIHNKDKVIRKYHKSCNIDAQNDKKETALHIACIRGHYEAAVELMANKAKSNIGNLNGENALHVTALSPKTTPGLARAVVEHTIKSHDWESVNSTDNIGNNALHLAGKFATPDVLWEFRFVRFKDTDVDGNTPLHESVRQGEPEVLETVLDIYENMQRDADINTPNNNSETVLHLAAGAGFAESVTRLIFYGSDLTCADAKGNTVLHQLVEATVKDESNCKVYMRVVDTILNDSVRWWCKRNQIRFPGDDNKEFTKIQRIAVNTLLGKYYNKANMSVIAYAFKLGADQFLARVLTMSNVTEFQRDKNIYFDISHMTPTTNKPGQSREGSISTLMPSYIELLVSVSSQRAKERSSHVLDIPPVRQVERMYTAICAWAYAFFLILHILYMTGFTFLGINIASKFRDNTNGTELSNSNPYWIAAYIVVPIEPVIFLGHLLATVCRAIARGDQKYLLQEKFTICFHVVFSAFAICWLVLISIKDSDEDYVLSITLCLGWLFSISFTRGFKTVHYFYRMLLNMLVRDVFRFLIVFAFVLLAFSFALHVIFQISENVVNIYPSAGDTIFLVFNLMIGMAELFDSDFEDGMTSVGRNATYAKVVYLFYIILSTVVLLNLLIAMMNDSYSNILTNQKVTWRVDSVKIGVGVENLLPWFPSVFGKVKIEKARLHDNNDGSPEEARWYLVTTEEDIELYSPIPSQAENIGSLLDDRLGEVEKRLKDTEINTKVAMEKFDVIMQQLDELRKSNTRL